MKEMETQRVARLLGTHQHTESELGLPSQAKHNRRVETVQKDFLSHPVNLSVSQFLFFLQPINIFAVRAHLAT